MWAPLSWEFIGFMLRSSDADPLWYVFIRRWVFAYNLAGLQPHLQTFSTSFDFHISCHLILKHSWEEHYGTFLNNSFTFWKLERRGSPHTRAITQTSIWVSLFQWWTKGQTRFWQHILEQQGDNNCHGVLRTRVTPAPSATLFCLRVALIAVCCSTSNELEVNATFNSWLS